MINNNWFHEWFNSPYYHLLYNHRDETEAKSFIDQIIKYLHPNKTSAMLDVACGSGRHSIYLASKGYHVTGIDLSEESIKLAKWSQKENLHFYVHDMRTLFKENHFDYIFNLFTSFGYFDKKEDDILTLTAMKSDLKNSGTIILDFMNAKKIIHELVPFDEIIKDKVLFKVNRLFKNGFIEKNIEVNDENEKYHFLEKVRAIDLEMFTTYFDTCRLKIVDLFGDYQLNPFSEKTSDRLIMVLKK